LLQKIVEYEAYIDEEKAMVNTSLPPRLRGEIRSLANEDSDSWKRREIIVKREESYSYPDVRDFIKLVDTGGEVYKLSFIKGANRPGYALIGKPGTLKPWFKQRYSADEVDADNVFLELIQTTTQYRIFSSWEWKKLFG